MARIVVVGGDAMARRFQARALARSGHEVAEASDGVTAVRLCTERSFALALVALQLPDLSGVEVLRRMRAAQPGCMRLLMAPEVDLPQVVGAVNQGEVNRVLDSVLSADHLLAAVEDLLRTRAAMQDVLRVQEEAACAEERQALLECLRSDAVRLALQPILDARGDGVFAFEALLRSRLEDDWRRLRDCIPIYKALSVNRQAALLSFTYNCGPRWFGAKGFDTLSSALRAGQLEAVPAALMLYVNPGGPSEAGLRRRRKAEGALWNASPDQGSPPSPDRGSSHPNPLMDMPRFQQRDSAQLAQRDRTCFSSSCAMLLEAIKPGALQGANGDDQYLAVVQRFGDTTDANAQIRALAHYGVSARLVQNADFQLIEPPNPRGIPIPFR